MMGQGIRLPSLVCYKHIQYYTRHKHKNGTVECSAFQSYVVFIGEYFLLHYMSSRMKLKGISLKVMEKINHDSYKYVKKGISYFGYKITAPSYNIYKGQCS